MKHGVPNHFSMFRAGSYEFPVFPGCITYYVLNNNHYETPQNVQTLVRLSDINAILYLPMYHCWILEPTHTTRDTIDINTASLNIPKSSMRKHVTLPTRTEQATPYRIVRDHNSFCIALRCVKIPQFFIFLKPKKTL